MTAKIKIIREKSKNPKPKDPVAKQRLLWSVGHLMMLVFGCAFSITYFYHAINFYRYRDPKWLFLRYKQHFTIVDGTRWYHRILAHGPQLLYRLALLGGVLAYGTTMQQMSKGWSPTWYDMLSSNNFQTLLVTVLWLVNFGKSFYRIFPLMIISAIHLKNRNVEINSELTDLQKNEITNTNAKILSWVAFSEVFVMVSLLLDTFLMQSSTGGVSLAIYMMIFWLRINFSPYMQSTVLFLLEKLDKVVPKSKQKQWKQIKTFLMNKREAHKARLERYRQI